MVGYGRIGGWKSTPEELSAEFDCMEKNGLLKPTRLLTGKVTLSCSSRVFATFSSGYVPDVDALVVISEIVRRLCHRDPNIIYLLDRM